MALRCHPSPFDPQTVVSITPQRAEPALDSGIYFLIVDSDAECGFARLVINNPTDSRQQSWGAVKSLYR